MRIFLQILLALIFSFGHVSAQNNTKLYASLPSDSLVKEYVEVQLVNGKTRINVFGTNNYGKFYTYSIKGDPLNNPPTETYSYTNLRPDLFSSIPKIFIPDSTWTQKSTYYVHVKEGPFPDYPWGLDSNEYDDSYLALGFRLAWSNLFAYHRIYKHID